MWNQEPMVMGSWWNVNVYVSYLPQITAYLREELAKANIQILTSETFAEDPTVQVKSLKVSRRSYHKANYFIY